MNWDFIYRGENRRLDDAERAHVGGAFVRLPDGCTHYELAGPSSGAAVVLIHGFSVPYFIWDPTFETLVAAGHRVLRYDLLGRGYSDRPAVDYDIALFVRQLAELLEALDVTKIDLIGLSMGGAIATAFTCQYPSRVGRLALIDPIGTEPMPLSMLYKAALLPGISELILGVVGTEQMLESLASDFYDPAQVQQFRDRYRVQMQYRGFKRAIVSTLRNKAVDGFPALYDELGHLDIPLLLLWGRHDRTLPLAQSAGILERVPRADFRIIESAGHIPNCEQPEVVGPILLEFLGSR